MPIRPPHGAGAVVSLRPPHRASSGGRPLHVQPTCFQHHKFRRPTSYHLPGSAAANGFPRQDRLPARALRQHQGRQDRRDAGSGLAVVPAPARTRQGCPLTSHLRQPACQGDQVRAPPLWHKRAPGCVVAPSPAAQRFRFESLPDRRVRLSRAWPSRMRSPSGHSGGTPPDNTLTRLEQAAFRADWPRFIQTLSARDRNIAELLSLGHSAKYAAARFNLSQGRVTQIRARLVASLAGTGAPPARAS